ncbi:putative transcription factor CG1-CAMTA family [Rosa chinensis]|uniref:Putative transcription factor CG1-CAMTA family n=1 Tax=Rosa chinensis TaxID=74649 RepID=A0A2P6PK29_ROSCH|nr:putative transcription factor CG1-CAMTA family [Rosa chinensis]
MIALPFFAYIKSYFVRDSFVLKLKLLTKNCTSFQVGNVNVLRCSYYDHGGENRNFQRRIYSMLEEDYKKSNFQPQLETK